MGFFKKITKAVSKPVVSAVKSTVKNAVPLTAAFLTGGASLTTLKPSGGLFDKAYGAIGMGAPKDIGASIEQVAVDYAQEKISNEAERFVTKQVTKATMPRKNSQTTSITKPITESASETFDTIAEKVGGKSKLYIIIGGVFVVIFASMFMRGKK